MRSSELYTMTSKIHEKKGTWIYIVRLDVTVEPELFKKLRAMAKEDNGYYSTYRDVHGFVFKHESDADDFCDTLDDTLVITDDEEEQPTSHNSEYITVHSLDKDEKETDDNSSNSIHEDNSEDYGDNNDEYEDNENSDKYSNSDELNDFIEITGSKLADALKYIVKKRGKASILNPKIVNVLSDLQSYSDSEPFQRFVLKAIITEGYSRKLLTIGGWNTECQKLIQQFVSETGVQLSIANQIFRNLAYSLDWINEPIEEKVIEEDQENIIEEKKTKTKPIRKRGSKTKSNHNDLLKQALYESFDIIKDNWKDKSEAITKAIVKMEKYDRNLSSSMWLYEVKANMFWANNDEEYSQKLGYDVMFEFWSVHEKYINTLYQCHAMGQFVLPTIENNEELLNLLFGTLRNACNHSLWTIHPYGSVCLSCAIADNNIKLTNKIMRLVCSNNNMIEVSLGTFIATAFKYVEDMLNDDCNYKNFLNISDDMIDLLLDNLKLIKDSQQKAECKIALMTLIR